ESSHLSLHDALPIFDIKHKHIRLGVQENRITKYFDDTRCTAIAILDFGLTPAQEESVVSGALELVAGGTRYSLREIAATAWAMRSEEHTSELQSQSK